MLQVKQKVGEITHTFHKIDKNLYIFFLGVRKLLQNNLTQTIGNLMILLQ